jgi:hypothetical protein
LFLHEDYEEREDEEEEVAPEEAVEEQVPGEHCGSGEGPVKKPGLFVVDAHRVFPEQRLADLVIFKLAGTQGEPLPSLLFRQH